MKFVKALAMLDVVVVGSVTQGLTPSARTSMVLLHFEIISHNGHTPTMHARGCLDIKMISQAISK